MEKNWTSQFNASSYLFLKVPQAGCRGLHHTAHGHQPESVPLGEWSPRQQEAEVRGTIDCVPSAFIC